MASKVIVYKGRTNTLKISLGFDVSTDTITSEIRTEPNFNSPLIATWDVTFATNGSDGNLILTLDDIQTAQIVVDSGYMDLKRMKGIEPLAVFDRPLEVSFRGTVTA